MPYFFELYPPVVPTSLPAYDGTQEQKIYFQVSMANSRDQFQHAQVIIHKLQSNRDSLQGLKYINHYSNTKTTLSTALDIGDTIVNLTDASGWATGTDDVDAYNKNIALWSDVSKYSSASSVATASYKTKSSNILTLSSPWEGPRMAEGTLVANCYNGSFGKIFYKNNEIYYDAEKDMYYVTIPAGLLPLDTYYKVQIRLGEQDLNAITIDYNWLNSPDNAALFSEWSTVCVIKPTKVPTFGLIGFGSLDAVGAFVEPVYDIPTNTYVNVVRTGGFLFVGTYAAKDTNKEEVIKNYRMVLYEDNGTSIKNSWTKLSDSGVKTIGQYEAANIQHEFDYYLETDKTYFVEYIVTSRNGYTNSKIYKILVKYTNMAYSHNFTITPMPDQAKIRLEVDGTIEGTTTRGVIIRRSSNRSNFRKWEDVVTVPLDLVENKFNATYDDLFVESGVAYHYAIQPYYGKSRGVLSTPKTVIFDYDHPWLIGENQTQLMFGYDTQISSFGNVIKDSVVETIGGRYPYILRNADLNYKQFQLTATITYFMDPNKEFMYDGNAFLDKGETVDSEANTVEVYNDFYKNNGMNKDNNYILEREFRSKIMEFLYDGKPKLFKSDMEGMMLGKITDISFSPKTELGRMIYSVSFKFTEMGPVTLDNLIDNKIKQGVKFNDI